MTNMTGDNFDELAARVSALETPVGSLRARTADTRGELGQVHDAVQDIRQVQGEHGEWLEEHSRFHLSHTQGLVTLTEQGTEHAATLADHGIMLREILRRLAAA